MPSLFLRFAWHANHGQLSRVPLHVARESLTQRSGITRIGLYPSTLLIEFTRRDHIAVRAGSLQVSIETKPKTACFIDHVYYVTSSHELPYPWHKLRGRQSPCRLGQELIVLRHCHIDPCVHIQTDLDDRAAAFYLCSGRLE